MNKSVAILTVVALAVTGSFLGVAAADAATPKRPTGIHIFGYDNTKAKPKNINLSADGAFSVTKIWWKTWNTKKAVGYGSARINNCVPNCADSKSFSYTDVQVTATKVDKKNKFRHLRVEQAYNENANISWARNYK